MVQKSQTISIILAILSRFCLTAIAISVGLFFFPVTLHDFFANTLGYIRPNGFFGFTFADWMLPWEAATIFWMGIILGAFGKKIDYIFIILFFLLFSWDFLFADNMTPLVYSGLVGATIAGNAIGFGLKILRKQFFVGGHSLGKL